MQQSWYDQNHAHAGWITVLLKPVNWNINEENLTRDMVSSTLLERKGWQKKDHFWILTCNLSWTSIFLFNFYPSSLVPYEEGNPIKESQGADFLWGCIPSTQPSVLYWNKANKEHKPRIWVARRLHIFNPKNIVSFKEEVEDDYKNRANVVLMVVREGDHMDRRILRKKTNDKTTIKFAVKDLKINMAGTLQ